MFYPMRNLNLFLLTNHRYVILLRLWTCLWSRQKKIVFFLKYSYTEIKYNLSIQSTALMFIFMSNGFLNKRTEYLVILSVFVRLSLSISIYLNLYLSLRDIITFHTWVWYIIGIISSSPTHFHSEIIRLIRVSNDLPC